MKTIKIPNADHPITIVPTARRVRVLFGKKIVADTNEALTLSESDYPPVYYVPLRDVDAKLLEASDNQTYCPYKGDATYFNVAVGGKRAVDAVWTYEAPYDAVAGIKGHVAFYPDRIDAIELT